MNFDPGYVELDQTNINRRALEEIFSEEPAANQSNYIPSVLLEIRTVLADGANVPHNRTYYTIPPDLPPWLRGGFQLPPWEARLLYMLFSFSRPVLMIRGGSGSGKTSSLKLIDRYCVETLKSSGQTFSNIYGFRTPLLPLELQSLSDTLTTRFTQQDQIESQVNKTFTEVSDLIDGALYDQMPWDNFGLVFKNAVVTPPVPHRASTSRISAVRAKLRRHIGDVVNKSDLDGGVGDYISSNQAKAALDKLDSARDQLVARILLLAELGRCLQKSDGISLTLVLDNVDPMPEYLQRRLFRELESLGFGLYPLFFRIAIFSRLSTAARYFKAGARAGAESIEEFHSPDPAMVVIHQATRFLLAPDRYPHFQGLSIGQRAHISRRILMLWRALQDPSGEFRKLLSGLAGSNIRNAYLLSINWCLSPEWPRQTSVMQMEALAKAFRFACAAILIDELGASLLRGLVLFWDEEAMEGLRGRFPQEPEKVAEEVAVELSNLFARLLADHRLVRIRGKEESFPVGAKCIRSFFMEELRGNVNTLLSPNQDVDLALLTGVMQQFELCGTYLRQLFTPEEFNWFLHEVKVAFSDNILKDNIDQRRDGLIGKLETEVRKAFMEGYSDPKTKEFYATKREKWIYSVSARLDKYTRRSGPGRENRFRAATTLIDPQLEGEPFEQCAVNVFSSDGKGLSPLPLFTLSFLRETSVGLQRQQLLDNLEKVMGFSKTEVEKGLLEMVRKERRLVFSSVRDHHDGIASWRENPDPLVHISSAGISYLRDVLTFPAYLQWALQRPKAIRRMLASAGMAKAPSALVRFRVTRFCFARHIENERGYMREKWQHLFFGGTHLREEQEAKCQSPVLTVLLRSLPNFLQDMSHHANNLLRKELTTEYAEVLAEAEEWIHLAERGVSEHLDTFDTEATEWNLELAFCRSFIRTDFE